MLIAIPLGVRRAITSLTRRLENDTPPFIEPFPVRKITKVISILCPLFSEMRDDNTLDR